MNDSYFRNILDHVQKVNDSIDNFCIELTERGWRHDASSFKEPEVSLLNECIPILYNDKDNITDEMLEKFDEWKLVHLKQNSHHPLYYDNGVNGMDLLDIIEMFFDWYTKNPKLSLEDKINIPGLSEQLYNIFKNTLNNKKLFPDEDSNNK